MTIAVKYTADIIIMGVSIRKVNEAGLVKLTGIEFPFFCHI